MGVLPLMQGTTVLPAERIAPSLSPLARKASAGLIGCLILTLAGCGQTLGTEPGPLFLVPLSVSNSPAEAAVVDTGGAYELMLRHGHDLPVIGEVQVLIFGGREWVEFTGSFPYEAGGERQVADYAIVGLPVCDCNGVGVQFFRKSGVTLHLDYRTTTAAFVEDTPADGIVLPFQDSPPQLPTFDTAFVDVTVTRNGETVSLLGILDTGTNSTLLRRSVFGESPIGGYLPVRVAHDSLGTVALNARLFDTEDLPDIIIGTDVMGSWADQWYFTFDERGGHVTVLDLNTLPSTTGPDAAR